MIDLVTILEGKLPVVIYPNRIDGNVLWENDYQRKETAKAIAIFVVEQQIKILEKVRGEYLSIHDGNRSIPIDTKLKDLLQLINDIKTS